MTGAVVQTLPTRTIQKACYSSEKPRAHTTPMGGMTKGNAATSTGTKSRSTGITFQ